MPIGRWVWKRHNPLAGALAVLSGVGLSQHLSARQKFTAIYAVVLLAYFGRMAVREWGLMKASAR
jgi:hypothetical protein